MKTYWLIYFILIIFGGKGLFAQGYIYPDLTGEALRTKLVEDYKPAFVELYREAREIIYTEIDNINDTVHTIYTDHTLYLPPTETYPITYLARDASPDGINAEHIYPRSRGARPEYGNAFSDMHNLYACRWEVNGDRSNYPYGEIEDTDTDYWFYKNKKLREVPDISDNKIDMYSELDNKWGNKGIFEPRESMKGNIARAVFYFFTMYRSEVMRTDTTFFEGMRETLCQWHIDDPIDERELARSQMVAIYQDGKDNPFVLDCTLANRLYCPDNPPMCQDLSTDVEDIPLQIKEDFKPAIRVFPNPSSGIFKLDVSNIDPGIYTLEIFSSSGQRMYSITEHLDYFNTINLWNARSGLYFLHLMDHDSEQKYSTSFQLIRK